MASKDIHFAGVNERLVNNRPASPRGCHQHSFTMIYGDGLTWCLAGTLDPVLWSSWLWDAHSSVMRTAVSDGLQSRFPAKASYRERRRGAGVDFESQRAPRACCPEQSVHLKVVPLTSPWWEITDVFVT